MDTTAMTSPLTDGRPIPLGKLSAPDIVDRLRPATPGKVTVAAFNSAL